ncbi:DNA repair protein RadC (plasmid) [Paenibacillus rhizovicinus]|uniref:DNA repair protein RadC n=1 Tax=Paenibacillus rhizovicinus TaxID=2704463 RepID=A0A6C0PA82_9BACL|nr:DNA repair protein RadC [Paenibacillus rhizovicinus]QHW35467.1 DNA repair protein RadC [Paenibacillus rhizovicinus]
MSVKELNAFAVREIRNNYYLTGQVKSLSTRDLIVLLMEPVTSSRSLSLLADELLQHGLRDLSELSEYELSFRYGLDERQSFFLASLLELGRRQYFSRKEDRVIIRSAGDVADLMMDMCFLEKEHFVCLFLDTKNHVIAKETISIGTLDAALVHPREVFRAAIRHGSSTIVAVHNHPSGIPTPSQEDIHLTKRLCEAGELVGIGLSDHIIIGDRVHSSLRELGHF